MAGALNFEETRTPSRTVSFIIKPCTQANCAVLYELGETESTRRHAMHTCMYRHVKYAIHGSRRGTRVLWPFISNQKGLRTIRHITLDMPCGPTHAHLILMLNLIPRVRI